MAERLTYSGTKEAKSNVTIKEVTDKLACYEDLEEAGRLIILPDGINFNKLVSLLTNTPDSCPGEYSLKNRCELSCFECWLAALKGADK